MEPHELNVWSYSPDILSSYATVSAGNVSPWEGVPAASSIGILISNSWIWSRAHKIVGNVMCHRFSMHCVSICLLREIKLSTFGLNIKHAWRFQLIPLAYYTRKHNSAWLLYHTIEPYDNSQQLFPSSFVSMFIPPEPNFTIEIFPMFIVSILTRSCRFIEIHQNNRLLLYELNSIPVPPFTRLSDCLITTKGCSTHFQWLC